MKNKFFSSFNNFSTFKKFNFNGFNKFSKKGFSSNNAGKAATMFKYGALGFACGGLGILSMNNMKNSAAYNKALASQQSYNKDIVNTRVRDTFVYFLGGLGLTAGLTTALARSRFVIYSMNPLSLLLTLPVSMFCMYKVTTTPASDALKPVYFLGMNAAMAFNLCPLGAMMAASTLRDAGILTLGLCGGLGTIAATSRDDAFAGVSGYLGAGLGVIAALSIANIFLNSPVIHNIWLYGGLALFSFVIMSDIKDVQIRAAKSAHYDAMAQSIHVYLDAINLFVRIAMILDSKKRK